MFGNNQSPEINFTDFLGTFGSPQAFARNPEGIDTTGNNIINKNSMGEDRSKKAKKRNPYYINPRNAINPNVAFADEVLAKGNKSFGSGQNLMQQYQQARGE
jgi:hypothetical protein